MPLGNLVRDKEGLVVAEELGNTVTRHRAESLHDKILDGIRNGPVPENYGSNCLFGVSVRVFEREG